MGFEYVDDGVSYLLSELRIRTIEVVILQDDGPSAFLIPSFYRTSYIPLLGCIEDHLSSREHCWDLVEAAWSLYESTVCEPWDWYAPDFTDSYWTHFIGRSNERVDTIDCSIDKIFHHSDRRIKYWFCCSSYRGEHARECSGECSRSITWEPGGERFPYVYHAVLQPVPFIDCRCRYRIPHSREKCSNGGEYGSSGCFDTVPYSRCGSSYRIPCLGPLQWYPFNESIPPEFYRLPCENPLIIERLE